MIATPTPPMARGTDGLLAFLELARLSEKWPQVRVSNKKRSHWVLGCDIGGAKEQPG